MAGFVDFLQRLLAEGVVVLHERPRINVAERAKATAVLEKAFACASLQVAGPRLDFDAPTALAGAELVWLASWFLVVRSDEPDEVASALRMPEPGAQPGQHLSADLTLRYLPQVFHRARGLAADDVLTAGLARILRQWPLSGVLVGLEEGPASTIEAMDHPGLLLLYAERLAEQPTPAWTPLQGPARDWVERVFDERGLAVP